MLNGVEILVRPDHVLILNGPTLIRGSQAEGAQFGFVLGNQDVPGSDMIRIRDLNRYLSREATATPSPGSTSSWKRLGCQVMQAT